MCILLQHPAGTKFSHDQLADFFSKNSDGFGAIVKRGESVDVLKSIGKFKEIAELYYKHVAGNEAVIHFRMRTHGEIDISNCHPYEVIPGIWMAHNGVLSFGNKADDKMSDTWHYIQDYLKPLLEKNPELLSEPAFQALIASHIGSSNKFAFMNQQGETFIINKKSGVEHEGVWYSNTYAWSPSRFGYYQPKTYSYHRTSPYDQWDESAYDHSRFATSSTWKAWDEIDRKQAAESKSKQLAIPLDAPLPKAKRKKVWTPMDMTENQLTNMIRSTYNVVLINDFNEVVKWVEDHPLAAMNFLYQMWGAQEKDASYISDMVNDEPLLAAEGILEIWEEEEDMLLDMADITFKKKGNKNAIRKSIV